MSKPTPSDGSGRLSRAVQAAYDAALAARAATHPPANEPTPVSTSATPPGAGPTRSTAEAATPPAEPATSPAEPATSPAEPTSSAAGPATDRRADLVAGPGGVMTDEVGVVTGDLTLRCEYADGHVTLRVQYQEADEWYTVTGGRVPLHDPADLDAVHAVALALLHRPEG